MRSDKSLASRQPILASGPRPRTGGFTLHACLVAFEKGDIVGQHDELVAIESAGSGGVQSSFALLPSPEINIHEAQAVIADPKIRVEFDGFLRLRQRLF